MTTTEAGAMFEKLTPSQITKFYLTLLSAEHRSYRFLQHTISIQVKPDEYARVLEQWRDISRLKTDFYCDHVDILVKQPVRIGGLF